MLWIGLALPQLKIKVKVVHSFTVLPDCVVKNGVGEKHHEDEVKVFAKRELALRAITEAILRRCALKAVAVTSRRYGCLSE